MAKFVPKIAGEYLNFVPNETQQDIVSYASKALRGKIILDRITRGFPNVDRDGGSDAYEYEKHRREGQGSEYKQWIEESREEQANKKVAEPNKADYSDFVSIIDLKSYIEFQDRDIVGGNYNWNDLVDDSNLSYIVLPYIPRALNYDINSNFVGIPSFGRNNPFYQYTGSEDTLSFEIDWHSNEIGREDVIKNCRWVESLAKADGYNSTPSIVLLVWGMGNRLFKKDLWIVTNASYSLTQFVKGYKDPNTGDFNKVALLPQQAYQRVTLKRVTSQNRTITDIRGLAL